jgi:hypothetical protein
MAVKWRSAEALTSAIGRRIRDEGASENAKPPASASQHPAGDRVEFF